MGRVVTVCRPVPLLCYNMGMDSNSTATILPIHTFTGKKFYPLDPKVEDISIIDIAHGLSNVCRYGGQCKEFYSVAQHSVLCAIEAPYEYKKWALLHDASEAYIGDIVHPLKVTEEYDAYRVAEEILMKAICERFDLPTEMPEEVHEIDLLIRHTEMRDFGSVSEEFWKDEPMMEYTIKPLEPKESKILFLKEFSRLFGYGTDAWRYFE